jgi:hypothetical protein
MKKHFNKNSAKKLMIIGGSMFAISYILNFVVVFSVVDECLDKAANCTLGTEQVIGEIAVIIGYVGIGLFLVGLILLLIELAKKKKQKKFLRKV